MRRTGDRGEVRDQSAHFRMKQFGVSTQESESRSNVSCKHVASMMKAGLVMDIPVEATVVQHHCFGYSEQHPMLCCSPVLPEHYVTE